MKKDGLDTIVVHVIQEDIELGKRGLPFSCPIARAAKRAGAERPAVCQSDMTTDHGHYFPIAEHEQTLKDWVDNFDREEPVEPVSITFKKGFLTRP